ncbi:cadherin repeat domain-containing protein, partial [uncultured Spongiibacter sp.]|uniref:cadherin repeat domain-containing protein n=1 Tax=uncultured Spongiibacter sp. TaxID=870896 RepID=UPI00259662D5
MLAATDAGSTHSTAHTITVTITDTNDESPTDMALSAASAAENAAAGTDIGTLSTTDGDASGNSHVYTLVTDSGGATAYSGTDFALDSAVLEVGSSPSFDYETTTSYTVYVKVADGSNTAYVEGFTISIT